MIQPSCPALVIFDDDAFRKSLVTTLDANHFMVTAVDEQAAPAELERKRFSVVVVGIDLKAQKGIGALEYLRDHQEAIRCGIIIVGAADPQIRSFAPWADETLLRPVDPQYVASRARAYCGCSSATAGRA